MSTLSLKQTELEDPRARAAKRLAELQGNWGGDMPPDADTSDRFYFDPAIIPDGWSYEWKTFEIFGKQDPQYQVELSVGGWEAVPCSRHPELMPAGWTGKTIDRQGMRLMERPLVVTQHAQQRDRRKAQMQVSNKEQSLAGETAGAFDPRKPVIRRDSEQISVPK